MPPTPPRQPLANVRVVEFCSMAAGPFAALLLADMGADVVKIEPPQGDGMRAWPPLRNGYSENFASLNRNKRSIVLDLKASDDLALARRLVAQADVLVENNRPGVMDRLGLGYDALAATQPALVYCSISAFGQSGPRTDEGGFDLTIQAAAGVMSVTGEPDGEPVKCGVPLADFATGLYGAFAVSSALLEVRATGRGAHIDVPMFGCTLAIAALQTSEYFGNARDPVRMGSAHPRNAPYQAFRAADGWFAIAAGNDKLWHAVCRVVERTDLASDPRFVKNVDRARNQAALKDVLEQLFVERPVDHWIAAMRDAGVPHSRINDYSTALEDPQTRHMGWIDDVLLPGGAASRTFLSPLRFDGAGFPMRLAPPALDEHGAAIRAHLDPHAATENPHGDD